MGADFCNVASGAPLPRASASPSPELPTLRNAAFSSSPLAVCATPSTAYRHSPWLVPSAAAEAELAKPHRWHEPATAAAAAATPLRVTALCNRVSISSTVTFDLAGAAQRSEPAESRLLARVLAFYRPAAKLRHNLLTLGCERCSLRGPMRAPWWQRQLVPPSNRSAAAGLVGTFDLHDFDLSGSPD